MSVRPSVRPSVTHELKSAISAVFDQNASYAVYPALFISKCVISRNDYMNRCRITKTTSGNVIMQFPSKTTFFDLSISMNVLHALRDDYQDSKTCFVLSHFRLSSLVNADERPLHCG